MCPVPAPHSPFRALHVGSAFMGSLRQPRHQSHQQPVLLKSVAAQEPAARWQLASQTVLGWQDVTLTSSRESGLLLSTGRSSHHLWS